MIRMKGKPISVPDPGPISQMSHVNAHEIFVAGIVAVTYYFYCTKELQIAGGRMCEDSSCQRVQAANAVSQINTKNSMNYQIR